MEVIRMDKPSREKKAASNTELPSEARDVRLIKLSDIYPDPLRKPGKYDDAELCVIARGFLRHGIGFPITAAEIPELKNKFMLVSGEKIFRAALIAGLKRLPCIISEEYPRHLPECRASEEMSAKPCVVPTSANTFGGASPPPKSKIAIKDSRFFFNSVYHAVDLMRQSGIPVSCGTRDDGGQTVLIITVPKSPPI